MPDDLVELGKDGDIGAIARLERDRYLNSGGK